MFETSIMYMYQRAKTGLAMICLLLQIKNFIAWERGYGMLKHTTTSSEDLTQVSACKSLTDEV